MSGRATVRSTRSTAASSSASESASGACAGSRRLRQIRARELIAALFAATLEHVDDLAHLLVLEQPSHELGARIFPLLLVAVRQQHLRLDAQQPRGHLEILGGLVESERPDAHDELLADARDGNVVDVELLFANEREEQVERARERRHLDDEAPVRIAEAGSDAALSGDGMNASGCRSGSLDAQASHRGSEGQRVWIGETEQQLAERKRAERSQALRKDAAEAEQQHENDDAVPADLLIPDRQPQRQHVLHDVRAVERRNGDQVERRASSRLSSHGDEPSSLA